MLTLRLAGRTTAAIRIDFPAGYVDEFESWPPVRPRKPLHLKELNSLDVFVKSLNEVPYRFPVLQLPCCSQ
jgi:hypothetical protein